MIPAIVNCPKVEKKISSQPLSQKAAFGMLTRFLKNEQKLSSSYMENLWDDLYCMGETIADPSSSSELRRLQKLQASRAATVTDSTPAAVPSETEKATETAPDQTDVKVKVEINEDKVQEEEKTRKREAKREKKEAKKRKRKK